MDAVVLRFARFAEGSGGDVQLLGSELNISSSTPYEVISRQISGSCAEVRLGGPGLEMGEKGMKLRRVRLEATNLVFFTKQIAILW